MLLEELSAERARVAKKYHLPRTATITLGTLAGLILAAALIVVGYRYQHRPIYEAKYVPIGGIDQWVQIRGFDRTNPVLLWVHGGPGASTIPETASYNEWEGHFTVVMWDQRGAGKTDEKYGRSVAASMSIPRMVADGIEIATYLRKHLRKNKIIIMGHSWGSILGIHMAKERPEFFSAYVGTGQFTDVKRSMLFSYPELVKRAEKYNRMQTLLGLRAMGAPPYDRPEKYRVLSGVANVLDPPVAQSTEAQLLESRTLTSSARGTPEGDQGELFFQALLFSEILEEDLAASATSFRIPMIFIDGPEDLVAPNAKSYFDAIDAPSKEFVTLPGTGHFAVFRAPDRMLEQLVEHLSRLAE